MSRSTKLFGFWTAPDSENKAREAIKMAGLPVLIVGLNSVALALSSAVKSQPNIMSVAVWLTLALLLIPIAFRIRAGHASWIPIACFSYFIFFANKAASLLLGYNNYAGFNLSTIFTVLGWVVPLMCLSLTIAGLNGWIWLSRSKIKLTY